MRHRRRARLTLLLTLIVIPGLTAPARAEPQDGGSSPDDALLGWSACAWGDGQVVRVGISPDYAFPEPGFADRLDEAVGRWDEVLAATPAGVRMVRDDAAPDVVFEYAPLTDGAPDEPALAETYLRRAGDDEASPDIGRCPDRRPAAHPLVEATIRVVPRDDWYTGPDDDLERWEACPDGLMMVMGGDGCERSVDFGSTALHELGHTLVLYHPQTLDDIDGRPYDQPGSATEAAGCVEAGGSFPDQATMCAGQGRWRAEQRTLSPWDLESARRQYSQ